MSSQSDQELRKTFIDLCAGRHICDDEGFGCEIEEFEGDWPESKGRYFRCKLEREWYDEVMALFHSHMQTAFNDVIGSNDHTKKELEPYEARWYSTRNNLRSEQHQRAAKWLGGDK